MVFLVGFMNDEQEASNGSVVLCEILIPNLSSRHCYNAIIQALEGPSRAAMTAGGAFRDLEEGTFAAEQQVL